MRKEVSQLGVYSVFDSARDQFGPLLAMKTEKEAIKTFNLFMLKVVPAVRSDYTLHKIGYFDEQSGKLDPCRVQKIEFKLPDFNDPAWMPPNAVKFPQKEKDNV